MLTDNRISEIKARCDKATPGPWEQHRPTGEYVHNPETNFNVCMTRRNSDSVFIAHARRDIPELLAEIERLKEDVRKRDFMIDNGLGWEDLENNCNL